MSLGVFLGLLILCCGYAALGGGAPERWSAGLQTVAFALGLPVHRALDAVGYRSAIAGTAAIDVALLVALSLLAWRSTRYWTVWIAGWQFAAVIAHFAKLLDPGMHNVGYAIQAQVWAYPMLLATAVGAWRHRARCRAGDIDPAWKPLPS